VLATDLGMNAGGAANEMSKRRITRRSFAMKTIPLLASLVLVLSLTACVPSLHPLYTTEDLRFDPNLLGDWREPEGQERWQFQPVSLSTGNVAYKLIHTDCEGVTGEFDVRLVNVGAERFLDLFPAEPDVRGNDFYQGHLQPMHTFVRLTQTPSELRLAYLKPEWLTEQLKANPDALRHERVKGEILLTAQPKELQRFLLLHLETPGAFEEALVLTRQ